jgi:hypothetical protein
MVFYIRIMLTFLSAHTQRSGSWWKRGHHIFAKARKMDLHQSNKLVSANQLAVCPRFFLSIFILKAFLAGHCLQYRVSPQKNCASKKGFLKTSKTGLERSWGTWDDLDDLTWLLKRWLDRTSQDRTWLDTWQDLTGLDRTWQDLTGLDRTGQDLTGLDRTSQDFTGLDRTWQDLTGLDRTWQDLTGFDRTWQDLTGLDRTWQDLAVLESTWPDLTPDRTWQVLTGLDRTWQDLTGLDRTWQDLTGLDRTWHHLTGLDRSWKDLKGLVTGQDSTGLEWTLFVYHPVLLVVYGIQSFFSSSFAIEAGESKVSPVGYWCHQWTRWRLLGVRPNCTLMQCYQFYTLRPITSLQPQNPLANILAYRKCDHHFPNWLHFSQHFTCLDEKKRSENAAFYSKNFT